MKLFHLLHWKNRKDLIFEKSVMYLPQWLFGPEKNSFHYWSAPRGPRGVKKSHFFFHKWKCFPFALRLPPKDTNSKKTSKLKKKCKKHCFLRYFRIFFSFGAILAHQTSTDMFSGSWRIFWHPWDLWGLIHLDLNKNSVRTGCVIYCIGIGLIIWARLETSK